MKKLLFIAAIAIGMVGCTNEEEVVKESAPSQITLQGVTKKASRGGLDGTILPNRTNIYCTGLLHNSGTTSYYFKNQTFSMTSDGHWIGSGISWPMAAAAGVSSMDFWAYTCAAYNSKLIEGSDPVSYSQEVDNTPTPTATFNKTTTGFSSLELDFGNNLKGKNDVMVSNIISGVECYGKTNNDVQTLEFKHTMAWIVVRIVAIGDNLNNKLKFYDITLDGVKVSGKLNVDASTLNCTWTPYQTLLGTDDTNNVQFPAYGEGTPATGVLLGEATSKPLDGLLVLPQTPTSITLNYAYDDGGSFDNGQTTTIALGGLSGTMNGSAYTGTPWEAGKKYVYTIKINTDEGKAIVLGASVTAYDQVDYTPTL